MTPIVSQQIGYLVLANFLVKNFSYNSIFLCIWVSISIVITLCHWGSSSIETVQTDTTGISVEQNSSCQARCQANLSGFKFSYTGCLSWNSPECRASLCKFVQEIQNSFFLIINVANQPLIVTPIWIKINILKSEEEEESRDNQTLERKAIAAFQPLLSPYWHIFERRFLPNTMIICWVYRDCYWKPQRQAHNFK